MGRAVSYNWNMAVPTHDWYLADWLQSLALNQTTLSARTGWGKRKTSELVRGIQRYSRDTLNEAADALNLRPFELLLHPADAMEYRQLRESLLRIAAENKLRYVPQPADDPLSVSVGGKR